MGFPNTWHRSTWVNSAKDWKIASLNRRSVRTSVNLWSPAFEQYGLDTGFETAAQARRWAEREVEKIYPAAQQTVDTVSLPQDLEASSAQISRAAQHSARSQSSNVKKARLNLTVWRSNHGKAFHLSTCAIDSGNTNVSRTNLVHSRRDSCTKLARIVQETGQHRAQQQSTKVVVKWRFASSKSDPGGNAASQPISYNDRPPTTCSRR